MAVGTSSFVPKDLTVNSATACKITDLVLTTSGTEYSLTLQADLKRIRIKCREMAVLQYSFNVGESATDYWTIPAGCVDEVEGLKFNSKTLYIQANKNSVTVEVMELY